jgi:alpha-tubulin suppressor-like RCC1 family protein
MATKTGGTLYAWGYNYYGQLGLSVDWNDRWTPTQVGSDTDWSRISAGSYHSLAVKQNNSLLGWGLNGSYQLGLGDTTNRNSPTKVK